MSGNDRPKSTTLGSFDCRGVPLSYAHRGAIEGLERAHECALAFRGDAIAAIDRVLLFCVPWLRRMCWNLVVVARAPKIWAHDTSASTPARTNASRFVMDTPRPAPAFVTR